MKRIRAWIRISKGVHFVITGWAVYLKIFFFSMHGNVMWCWQDWTSHTAALFIYLHNIVFRMSSLSHHPEEFTGTPTPLPLLFANPGGNVWMVVLKHIAIYFGRTFQSFYKCTTNNATVQLIIHVKCGHTITWGKVWSTLKTYIFK